MKSWRFPTTVEELLGSATTLTPKAAITRAEVDFVIQCVITIKGVCSEIEQTPFII
ncbi:hypothetical protein [Paenibacillus amylolyticus]|uniref:hypothetical protein n=1 Tax=Paenibacillus amylolyticus TaxID=1451 RepID=UPI001428B1EE|nr:hypothetical protein [Paenibacillus amylolyticus]